MYWVDNLKIKCMIFLTIVICSSTFFLSDVKAVGLEVKTLDYSNFEEYYNTYSTQLEELTNYLKNYNSSYYYFIYFTKSNFSVYLVEKSSYVTAYLSIDADYTLFIGKSSKYLDHYSISFTTSNFYSNFETLKTAIVNKNFTNNKYGFSTSTGYGSSYYKNYPIVYYTNFENFILNPSNTYALEIGGTIYQPGDVLPTYYDYNEATSLILKKESAYDLIENNCNSLKYIDIYFNKEDFQKQIKYELNYNDYNSEIESSFEYELAEISSFEIAYLVKDENGFYKWTKNNDIGVYIDHDTSSIPKNDGTGFDLTGIISLIYDDSVYSNIEQIKVSIGLSSAFKYSYSYYDNSSVTENDIDDYYSNMLGTNGRLYRNKQYEKYSVISTKEDLIKDTILVEYVNTDYHLYLEYFDTNLGSYIDSSMLVTSDYFLIKNRDFEKYQYKIGTSIEKGLYLMNYLYHNSNENLGSYYWFYVSLNVEYYNTNYLDESYYYDNTGEIDQNIIQNPNSETDNIKFSDTFRPFFSLVDDLEATRILFNDSFKIIYYSLPRMITLCLELLCHAICVVVLLQMLGWGDY